MERIDHTGHQHAGTPKARAICRRVTAERAWFVSALNDLVNGRDDLDALTMVRDQAVAAGQWQLADDLTHLINLPYDDIDGLTMIRDQYARR